MEHKNRKALRLKGYDYSKNGAYFVTICTRNRAHLFGEILKTNVGATLCGCPMPMLEKWFRELGKKYPTVTVD